MTATTTVMKSREPSAGERPARTTERSAGSTAITLHALDNVASVVVAPEGTQLVVRLAVLTGLAVHPAILPFSFL
jgi:hypothetical protein